MSGIMSLLIMIGEIIGFIIFSIILVIECDKKRKDNGQYTEGEIKKAKKSNIIYIIINNIIIIAMFFFSCPRLIFLSHHKTIYLSIIFVSSISTLLGYYIGGANLFDRVTPSPKVWISVILAGAGVAISLLVLIANVALAFHEEYVIEFKTCINQKETVETIYPEFIGESKIGHFEDSDKYIFGFKDNQGTWIIEDNLEVKPEDLKSSDNTYIEKHTITKTFKDIERYVESDDYITTEEEVTYVLFLNKEQLIELKTD